MVAEAVAVVFCFRTEKLDAIVVEAFVDIIEDIITTGVVITVGLVLVIKDAKEMTLVGLTLVIIEVVLAVVMRMTGVVKVLASLTVETVGITMLEIVTDLMLEMVTEVGLVTTEVAMMDVVKGFVRTLETVDSFVTVETFVVDIVRGFVLVFIVVVMPTSIMMTMMKFSEMTNLFVASTIIIATSLTLIVLSGVHIKVPVFPVCRTMVSMMTVISVAPAGTR